MRTPLVLCFMAVLSACDTKPKIDNNDICGHVLTDNGEALANDFKARLSATRKMDYSKRMDLALEYGFRATEATTIEERVSMHGPKSVHLNLVFHNICLGRR